jgi:ubiquinone/menaquinone biosynthesis C-methylase UbiE
VPVTILMASSTDVATHFEFGENWSDFAKGVDQRAVDEAIKGFSKLIHPVEVAGRSLLDIGCGSGLHSLAALLLGARKVTALDIDPRSVETTRRLLSERAPTGAWTARVESVFDLDDGPTYDIVYSWGVLHHTGDMHRAIRLAARKVAPGGIFCLALYCRTKTCGFWRIEKRLYTASPGWLRRTLEFGYKLMFRIGLTVTGRDFSSYVRDYAQRNRGMNFHTDVRDWLGGYPYESISERDTLDFIGGLGFAPLRRFCKPPGKGVFGTHCNEYVFVREPERAPV